MYIEALGRQLSICSFEEAERLTAFDKNYWHVISICGPQDRKALLPRAQSIYYACFDDVEDAASEHYRAPRETDIAGIFAFIDQLDSREPGSPLMIHCRQGISRSTAIALSLIYRSLPSASNRLPRAIELLLELRPQAKPNRLVLTLGLAQFLPLPQAERGVELILSDSRIQRNQFRSVEL